MKLADLGEERLIEFFKQNNRYHNKVLVGIGDDAAVVRIGKSTITYSCDMFVEGTHFLRKDDSFFLGAKAITACVSDLSSMGSKALFVSASLGVPSDIDFNYVKRLFKGLTETAKKFKVDLVTGDSVCSEKICLDISAIGTLFKRAILRNTAKLGDYIFVTGALGKARYNHGYTICNRAKESFYLAKGYNIHAMIDISDGLFKDLSRICKASRKGAVLLKENIPLYKKSTVSDALFKGEDFELLFCLGQAGAAKLIKEKKYKFSCIGRIVDESYNLSMVDKKGKVVILDKDLSFEHFKK